MKIPFVHLRVHTEYSVSEGAARISDNVKTEKKRAPRCVIGRAAELGAAALGIADLGNMFGAVKFYQACRKQGIKPLVGCDAAVSENGKNSRMFLLCADNGGYRRLNVLLSRAYSKNGGAVKSEWLQEDNRGLIALSGGPRGAVGIAVDRNDLQAAKLETGRWKECFGERFYVEIWRAGDSHAAGATAAAAHAGVPVAAAHPVQCAREEDKNMLDVRRCIAHNWLLRDESREKTFASPPHMLSAEEMRERFGGVPEALQNSAEIARRCNFSYTLGQNHLPKIDLPDGETPPKAVERLSREGLRRRLPDMADSEIYARRLREELEIINRMGYADYYLIVADFIGWAKRQNIPVGPGRGSGSASLAAFALGITDMDPIEHGLIFERFLNPERVSLPDFDVDFCVEGRDRVIEYVAEKYGAERVAQIVTFGQIGARSAVRDVGRVLAYPYSVCDRVARTIPGAPDTTLEKALAESEQFRNESKNPEVRELLEYSREVEGLTRNIGTHAGGVLIAPEPIVNFCPLYAAADTNSMVSQMDMDDIEKIGLVKFDFLGLKTLTILARAEAMLKAAGAVPPDFSVENIPVDDKKTYEIYGSGELKGVFQCESGGMREMMRRAKPDRFGDIVALIALYRPGPMDFMAPFIDGKHGRREITYPHPELKACLEETYGVWVYQEQVMETARKIAGYSLGEADLLRRAMGKKKPEEMEKQKRRFIEGAKKKLPVETAEKLFSQLSDFANYGFNKAHAAAYALISYRTAYLKARYPAALYAAAMCVSGEKDLKEFSDCARAAKIRLHPPDINTGRRDFYLSEEDGGIVYGLRAIKGVGLSLADDIAKERESRPFSNLFDFCRRIGAARLGRPAAENLAAAGAFDRLHKNRAAVLATLPVAMEESGRPGESLFGESANTLADAPEWDLRETLQEERRSLGLTLSGSFYSLYRDFLGGAGLRPRTLAELPEARGSARIAGVLGGLSTPAALRRRGLKMVLLEDEGTFGCEVTAPAEVIDGLGKIKEGLELLVAEGEPDGRRFRASRLYTAEGFVAKRARRVVVRCGAGAAAEKILRMLSPARAKDGRCEIILDYEGDSRCRISLGGGWRPGELLCARLRECAPDVLGVKVDYRAEDA